MVDEKREFFIKYSDADGNTQYSDPFKTPEEVITHHKSLGEEGLVVKRITKEELFDVVSYIKGLVAQKEQLEKLLKKLGWTGASY